MTPRVMPVLLLEDGGLVKTRQFGNARYVGDPINAVRIFNDKGADELVVLDISATRQGRQPDEEAIAEIVGEAFMPVAYGGGVRDVETATRLIQLGVQKIVVNSAALEAPNAVAAIGEHLGSSTLVISIDAGRRPDGTYEVVRRASVLTGIDVRRHARAAVALGCGEIFLNSIERDGEMTGYDHELVRSVASEVDIPVVACGGAGSLEDLASVVRDGGAAAAAAGSLFVFHGPHRAVLITYPSYEVRAALFASGESPRS